MSAVTRDIKHIMSMSQDLAMTTKPPLPPEAHRRPLSPPPVRRPQPPASSEVREARRLSRQCSDQPQPRHQSPPAWFHPCKPVTPPASILKPASHSSASLSKPPPPPRSPVTRLSSPSPVELRPVSPPPVTSRDSPPPPIIQKPSVPPPPVPIIQPSPIIPTAVIKSEPHQSPSQLDDDEDSDTVIDLDS